MGIHPTLLPVCPMALVRPSLFQFCLCSLCLFSYCVSFPLFSHSLLFLSSPVSTHFLISVPLVTTHYIIQFPYCIMSLKNFPCVTHNPQGLILSLCPIFSVVPSLCLPGPFPFS